MTQRTYDTPTPTDAATTESGWEGPAIPGLTPKPAALEVAGTTYEFIKPLERRGTGEVTWLAQRSTRHGPCGFVAVKRLLGPTASERRFRLVEEVELAFRLHHPAIAQVHAMVLHEKRPHIVMEYVEGPHLDTVLSAAAARGRPVSGAFALYVAAEVADALHHAHTAKDEKGRPLGVVHRDVSPRNVRVESGSGAVKLTHFGAAYTLLANREESPKDLLKGDVAYASPEYLWLKPLDARSDVFSLGIVLAELLTGAHPFDLEGPSVPAPDAPSPEEAPSLPLARMQTLMARFGPEDVERLAAGLAAPLPAILHRALAREPGERYGTAGEMGDALRGALAGQPQPYGRKQVAEELAQLLSDATAIREKADLVEGGLFPSVVGAHELAPDAGEQPERGSRDTPTPK